MNKLMKIIALQSQIDVTGKIYVSQMSSNGCGCGGGATNCNGNF